MEVYQDKQESSSHPISPSRFMVSTSTWQKHVLHAVWRREENHVESKSCWWWEGGAFAGTSGILFLFLKYANNVQTATTQSWSFHPPEPFGGWPFLTVRLELKFLLRGQSTLGRSDAGSHGDAGSPPSRSVKSNAVELGRCIVRGQRSGPCELQALQEGVILQTNSLER